MFRQKMQFFLHLFNGAFRKFRRKMQNATRRMQWRDSLRLRVCTRALAGHYEIQDRLTARRGQGEHASEPRPPALPVGRGNWSVTPVNFRVWIRLTDSEIMLMMSR